MFDVRSKWLTGVVLAAFLPTIIFGIIKYPGAPLKQHGAAFTDKAGHVYTAEQFWRFKLWERTMEVTGGAWAVVCIAGAVQHYWRTGSLRLDAPPKNSSSPPTV